MKRFLFMVALLSGCAVETVDSTKPNEDSARPPAEKSEPAKEPEKPAEPELPPEDPEIPEEEIVKTLAPIDESLVYIWDDYNKAIYCADDLPQKNSYMEPRQFLYNDGTKADVIAFEFYKPGNAFYIKVKELVEKKTDGITTGWEVVEKTYKQKNGKVTETDDVFPVYTPIPIKEFTFKGIYIGETPDHWTTFFPSDDYGKKMGFCSYPLKYISMVHQSGEVLWFIGERMDVDHPQLFTVEQITCEAKRWMDYAKVVTKG